MYVQKRFLLFLSIHNSKKKKEIPWKNTSSYTSSQWKLDVGIDGTYNLINPISISSIPLESVALMQWRLSAKSAKHETFGLWLLSKKCGLFSPATVKSVDKNISFANPI